MEKQARTGDGRGTNDDGGAGEAARAGMRRSWGGELLFFVLVGLTVFGLPAAIFWYNARLAHAEPGRVINLIARNDQVDGQVGHWLVQQGTGWAYGDDGAPAVIRVRQGEMVTLRLTAADAIHEFTLPAYGIKATVYPGDLTTVHFRADQAGEFPFLCTEYCGIGHWQMGGRLVVEPQAAGTAQGPAAALAAAKGGS